MATPASFFGAFAWNNPSSYCKVASILFVLDAAEIWWKERDGDGGLGKCMVVPFFFTHLSIWWTRNECNSEERMGVEVKLQRLA